MVLPQKGDLILFVKDYNFGFYVWLIYAYVVDLCGAIVFIWGLMHKPRLFLNQVIPIVVSVVLIIIPNLLYVINKNPISPYDPTPLSFLVIELIFAVLLKRYHLFRFDAYCPSFCF